jgi:tagatose-1,6-bisphosphate aldolase non-catalytic subunit AgaZ/GatZ
MAVLVASRNQIETPEVGSGYAQPFAQHPLMKFVSAVARRAEVSVPVLVCRDHGGPWQRYDERSSGLSETAALERARRSLVDDVRAGFRYLHIDMSAARPRLSTRELVTNTIELIQVCEMERANVDLPVIAYEVSTEHADEDVSSIADLDLFLEPLIDTLEERGLPRPTTVVVRCGTVCRERQNAGTFDAESAERLAAHVHGTYGMLVKEHNGDYVVPDELRQHTPAGIDMLNIGPSVGDAETMSLLALAERESTCVHYGSQSHFRERLLAAIRGRAPVSVWHPSGVAPPEDVLLATCGHYVFADSAVSRARDVLFANCTSTGIAQNPGETVTRDVLQVIMEVLSHLSGA